MKSLVATAVAIIGICFAWTVEGATEKPPLPRCDWIKAEEPVSSIRVAQIEHCCVGSRQCPDDTYDCFYACFGPLFNCTNKLIRAGYPSIVFDGYTPADCVAFILSTPWCNPVPQCSP